MKKAVLITLLILFVCALPFIGSALAIHAKNKRILDFSSSPKYEYMSKESIKVAERYCGGEGSWSQMGYNIDHEHVSIICDDEVEIEIRIKSDLPITPEKD